MLPPIKRAVQRGKLSEDLACNYLERHGLRLVQRNFRGPRGELDLIMQDTNSLIFIEVRYRKNHRYGSGAESVDRNKQTKLIATALYYLQRNPRLQNIAARIDVISITATPTEPDIQWIKNAIQMH